MIYIHRVVTEFLHFKSPVSSTAFWAKTIYPTAHVAVTLYVWRASTLCHIQCIWLKNHCTIYFLVIMGLLYLNYLRCSMNYKLTCAMTGGGRENFKELWNLTVVNTSFNYFPWNILCFTCTYVCIHVYVRIFRVFCLFPSSVRV